MTHWNLYAGAFTKEFEKVFADLQSSQNSWERAWVTGGTQSSAWKPDVGGPARRAYYSAGIERFSFDAVTGELRHIESVSGGLVNPQYLAMHPTLPVLYAAAYARAGRVMSLDIARGGCLEPQGAAASVGELPIAVAGPPRGNSDNVGHLRGGTL